MTAHVGTLFGHLLPGTLFTLWGLIWFRSAAPTTSPFGGTLLPRLALVIALPYAVGELWWASWIMTDSSVSNYQHATMYLGFALTAAAQLLANRGLVSHRLTSLTLGGAFGVTAGLLFAHGSHSPVSGAVHTLLSIVLLGCAAVSIAEGINPTRALAIARCWLTITAGTWLLQTAWVIYLSGYDMHSPGVVMRIHLFFMWHLMAVAIVMTAIHVRAHRQSRPSLAT